MADRYPYISSASAIVQLLDQLRNAFPQQITADTLKKLNIAPGNESYAINTIRFLGLVDVDGNRKSEAQQVFVLHDDAEFREAFSKLIATSYKGLFDLRGDAAWTLEEGPLVSFFRGTDQSTALVGGRQAKTFRTLAAYAGHGSSDPSTPSRAPRKTAAKVAKRPESPAKKAATSVNSVESDDKEKEQSREDSVGLTVRIEINLPAAGDQETYDRIFRSIRENLLNGS